jgi:hypothetical protein
MATKTKAPAAARDRGRHQPDFVYWDPERRSGFVVEVVGGTRRAADLLGVAPSQVSRWVNGESVPGAEQARRLIDLEHVLARLLLEWVPEVARDWLTTPNGFLDMIRPVDWIRERGAGDVLEAIQAEADGAYP